MAVQTVFSNETLAAVISALDATGPGDNGDFRCKCPFHNGERESFSFNPEKGFKCFVSECGKTGSFQALVGAVLNGHTEEKEKPKIRHVQKAVYRYENETGQLVFEVVRMEPKSFYQRCPDPSRPGKFLNRSVEAEKRIPYRLPILVTADLSRNILIVEGEKDADMLISLGFIATTNAGGAGKWLEQYNKYFVGRPVAILPDNDEAGKEHADKVAQNLHGIASSIRIVTGYFDDVGHKGDIGDWITKGHTKQEIINLVKSTPEWTPDEQEIENDDLNKFDLNDTGNGEAFVFLFGQDARYDYRSEKWILWNGNYWKPDDGGAVYRMAMQTAKNRKAAADKIEDEEKRKAVFKWGNTSQSTTKLDSILKIARALSPCECTGNPWNTNPYLFGVANGVIDFETGSFREGRRDDMITQISPVSYDENAKCPRWEQFLREIFDGTYQADMIDWIKRAVGYSLTGNTSEHAFMIAYGIGENGKSTFLRTIATIAGDYYRKTEMATFTTSRDDHVRNDIAALANARLVTTAESSGKQKFSTAMIKELTGEDDITARFLYGEDFTFRPQFKIWMTTNQPPDIPEHDRGIWRRIKRIPFNQNFEGRHDPTLDATLKSELPGILNWVIDGVTGWFEKGIPDLPVPIQQSTDTYRRESDPMKMFLDEFTRVTEHGKVYVVKLYKSYVDYCHTNGYEAKSNIVFGRRMAEMGFKSDRDPSGDIRLYSGIELLSLRDSSEN